MHPLYKGLSLPIWTLTPDWRAKVKQSWRWPGTVRETLSAREWRAPMGPRMLAELAFLAVSPSARETGYMRLWGERLGAMPVGMPLWSEATELSAKASAGSLALAHDSRAGVFSGRTFYLLLRDCLTWEVVQVEAGQTAAGMTLAGPLQSTWPVGSVLLPLVFGALERPEWTYHTDETAETQVRFTERYTRIADVLPDLYLTLGDGVTRLSLGDGAELKLN